MNSAQRDAVRRERQQLATARAQNPLPASSSSSSSSLPSQTRALKSAAASALDAWVDPDHHSHSEQTLPLHVSSASPPPPVPPPNMASTEPSSASKWFDSVSDTSGRSPLPFPSIPCQSKAARRYSPDIPSRPETPSRASPLQQSMSPASEMPSAALSFPARTPSPYTPSSYTSSPSFGVGVLQSTAHHHQLVRPPPPPSAHSGRHPTSWLPGVVTGLHSAHANKSGQQDSVRTNKSGQQALFRPPFRRPSVGAASDPALAEEAASPLRRSSWSHKRHVGPIAINDEPRLSGKDAMRSAATDEHGRRRLPGAASSTQGTTTFPSQATSTQGTSIFFPRAAALPPAPPSSSALLRRTKSLPSLIPDSMMPPPKLESSFNVLKARTKSISITDQPFVCEKCGVPRPPRSHATGDHFNTCRYCTQPVEDLTMAEQQKWCYICNKAHRRGEFLKWNGIEEKVCKPHHTLTVVDKMVETVAGFTRNPFHTVYVFRTWWSRMVRTLILLLTAYLLLAPWIVVGIHATFSPRLTAHQGGDLTEFIETISGLPTYARAFVSGSSWSKQVVCEIDGFLCDFFGQHTERLFGQEIFRRRKHYYFSPPCPAFPCSGVGKAFESDKSKLVLGYFLNNITKAILPIVRQYRELEKTVSISLAQYPSRVDQLSPVFLPVTVPTWLVARAQVLYYTPGNDAYFFVRATRPAWNFYRLLRTVIAICLPYPDLQIATYEATISSIRASLVADRHNIIAIEEAIDDYSMACVSLLRSAADRHPDVRRHLAPFSPELTEWLDQRPMKACLKARRPQVRTKRSMSAALVDIAKALSIPLSVPPPIAASKEEWSTGGTARLNYDERRDDRG